MSDRIEINEEQLNAVNGGAISYTWDKAANKGTLGINGNYKYYLLDKGAFLKVYNDMFGKYSDADIIRTLRDQGIIKKM